jgi:hypothetical protein
MKRLQRSVVAIIAIACLAACQTKEKVPASTVRAGAGFYVDNAVNSFGDGTSWASAWKNFSDIEWSSLKPGDSIYISGGAYGKTYTETLVVGASGSVGRPITITRGLDPGHNGAVIVNGQYVREYGVVVDGHNYVVVHGLDVRNHSDAGIRVRSATAGVIIEQNSVHSGAPNLGGNARGFDVRDNRGVRPVIVRHNQYATAASSNDQNDGIWSSGNEGVLYLGNRIVISNNYTGPDEGHNDCLQSRNDYGITVVGNYCEQDNSKTGDSQGIFIQDPYQGIFLVHDNVLYAPNTNSHQLSLENRTSSFSGILHAYNNTIYGGAYGCIRILNGPESTIKNNILVSTLPDAQALKIEGPRIAPKNIDYNLMYTPNSNYPVYVEDGDTLSAREWRAHGYDAHGVSGDPKFMGIAKRDFSLQSDSPAIDAGTPISEVRVDFGGVSRPQGKGYDIGAHEVQQPSPAQPPAM